MQELVVLGLDPGFRSFGWSAVGIAAGTWRVLDAGVLRTAKDHGKVQVRLGTDNGRRAEELRAGLRAVVARFAPACACAEAVSFVRSSSVMCQIGIAWGLVYALHLPTFEATPQEIKLACAALKTATKEQVARGLAARGLVPPLPPTASLHEHVWDSLGAVVACAKLPAFRFLLQAAGRG